MCIAIYKPPFKSITDEALKNSYENNDDGMGFMFSVNNNIRIYKNLNNFKKFLKVFRKTEKRFLNCGFVLHFRTSTAGATDKKNCHPFMINKSVAFCHNGIFTGFDTNRTIGESDTVKYMEECLKHLPEDFLNNSSIKALILRTCGSSKLVFLRNDGQVYLFGGGIWDNEVWYSNSGYKARTVYYNENYFDTDDITVYSSKRQCIKCKEEKNTNYSEMCKDCYLVVVKSDDLKESCFVCKTKLYGIKERFLGKHDTCNLDKISEKTSELLEEAKKLLNNKETLI
jgi:hypothetical protein